MLEGQSRALKTRMIV